MSQEAVRFANPAVQPREEGLAQPYSPHPRYQYNAKAVAAGGLIRIPKTRPIEAQASSAIPSVGGVSKSDGGRFKDPILRLDDSSSYVLGVDEGERRKIETAAGVRGLVIAERFKAKSIQARAAAYSSEGEYTSFSFMGTELKGLSIDGRKIRVEIDLDLLEELKTWQHLEKAFADRRMMDRISDRFFTGGQDEERDGPLIKGQVHTSLVTSVQVEGQPARKGHVVRLPGFGTLYFGEVWIQPHSRRLILFRAELDAEMCRKIAEKGSDERRPSRKERGLEERSFMIVNEDETGMDDGGDVEVGAVQPHGEGLP